MTQGNNTIKVRPIHIKSSLVGVGVVLVIIILQGIAKITQSILSSWGVPSQIAAWIALAGPEVIAIGLLLIGLRLNDWHIKSLIGPTQLHPIANIADNRDDCCISKQIASPDLGTGLILRMERRGDLRQHHAHNSDIQD
jgi:hypothetical protein